MRRISCLLVILFSLLPMVMGQQQWPMVSGDASGNSWASAEDALYPPFEIIESLLPYPIPGGINDFTIYNDLLVAGVTKSSGNVFYGVNMITKDTSWVFPIPGSGGSVMCIPAQNSDFVVVSAQGSKTLFCLNRETGSVHWNRDFYQGLSGRSPVIDDDRVYINTDTLFCLDISDGHTIWSYSGTPGQTAPAIYDNTCYLTANYKTIAVNKNNRDLIWEKYNSNFHWGVAAVDELFFYTVSNDSVIGRNKANGTIEWVYRIPGANFPEFMTKSIAVDDSVVVVSVYENADGVAQIVTVDKRTGDYLWDHSFTNIGIISPTLANGVLYILKGLDSNPFVYKLVAFNRKTGALFYTEDSKHYFVCQPVIYNNQLFLSGYGEFINLSNPKIPNVVQPFTCSEVGLMEVVPNPAIDRVNLKYSISSEGLYALQLFDINGRLVNSLFENRWQTGGTYSENIDIPAGLSNGMYFLRLESSHEYQSAKIDINR